MIGFARAAAGPTVVVGFVGEGAGVLFYNAASVIRDGGVAFVHRKVNVPTYGALDEGSSSRRGAGSTCSAWAGGGAPVS